MKELLWAGCANDDETMKTIRACKEEYDYCMDTHTAVAKTVYDKYVAATNDATKTVIASTASPFKFNQSVLIALKGCQAVAGKDEFTLLEMLKNESGLTIPASLAELKTKPKLFNLVCEKEQMQQVVSDFLQIN